MLNRLMFTQIREEHNRLGDSLKEFTRQFAQHDRTANLQNSVNAKKCDIVQNRISGRQPRFTRLKEILKILKANPRASKNAVVVVKLLKRQDNTCHGDIAHQDHNDCCRKNHKPFDTVIPQVSHQWTLPFLHCATPLSNMDSLDVFILTNTPKNYNGTKLRKVDWIMLFARFRVFVRIKTSKESIFDKGVAQ